MLTIRPYYPDDYLKLLPFLQKFDPSITNMAWNRLLGYEWENKLGYRGMLLEDQQEIVGFLCYILSTKEISGTSLTFCNISSWVVNPAFRSKSLKLLSGLFKLKDLVLINLSPHENILSIFETLGFQTLSGYEYRINPFTLNYHVSNAGSIDPVSCKEITEQAMHLSNLNAAIKKIIQEHRPYPNVHFYELIVTHNGKQEQLVLAFNQKKTYTEGFKNTMKELLYKLANKTEQLELLYCSNPGLLSENFTGVLSALIKNTKARSINISEHFLDKKNLQLPFAARIKKDRPWFLYTDTRVRECDIDILYTEKVLLNF